MAKDARHPIKKKAEERRETSRNKCFTFYFAIFICLENRKKTYFFCLSDTFFIFYYYLCARNRQPGPKTKGFGEKGNQVEILDSACCCYPHLSGLPV